MKITRLFSATFAAVCLATAALAAATPAGSWTWTQPGRDGDVTITAQLELKGEELTGTVANPMGEATITEASFKDGAIAFSVSGRRAATKYTGKLDGDKITGTIEMPGRGGAEPRKVEWTAKRTEAKK